MRLTSLLVAGLLVAVGCHGASSRALERGDRFAAAGRWDDAAAAYREAVEHAPRDPEAKIRLQRARERQIEARLARARALAERGDVRAALRAATQAVRLDPMSVPAQSGLSEVLEAMVQAAEARRRRGELPEALALVDEVVAVSPEHPGARALEARVRESLAARAMDRAQAHEAQGRLALAYLEAQRACAHRCDDAARAAIRRRLAEALRHTVVVAAEGVEVRAEAVPVAGAPFLQVVAAGEGRPLSVVAGEVVVTESQRTVTRSCDYVCGREQRANPAVERLRDELARAERALSQKEEAVARLEGKLLGAERGVTAEEDTVQRAQARVEEARERLERCKGRWAPNRSSPCSSEESTLRSRQRDLERARSGTSRERGDVQRARDRVEAARRAALEARRRRDRAKQELLRTPAQIEVERRCPFSYPAERHRRVASAPLRLDGVETPWEVVAEDDTAASVSDRCPSLRGGDPLELPSEEALRRQLRERLHDLLGTWARDRYEERRREQLAAGRAAEGRGDLDAAAEAYARYVLLAPERAEDARARALLRERHHAVVEDLSW